MKAKKSGEPPESDSPSHLPVKAGFQFSFAALDCESKVGGIPDLSVVSDVLRGCGVLACTKLGIDCPDLAVAVGGDGDIGMISVIGSGGAGSVSDLDLSGSAVDGNFDGISRGLNLGNADSRYGLRVDNYIKLSAGSPRSAILRLSNVSACGAITLCMILLI